MGVVSEPIKCWFIYVCWQIEKTVCNEQTNLYLLLLCHMLSVYAVCAQTICILCVDDFHLICTWFGECIVSHTLCNGVGLHSLSQVVAFVFFEMYLNAMLYIYITSIGCPIRKKK